MNQIDFLLQDIKNMDTSHAINEKIKIKLAEKVNSPDLIFLIAYIVLGCELSHILNDAPLCSITYKFILRRDVYVF